MQSFRSLPFVVGSLAVALTTRLAAQDPPRGSAPDTAAKDSASRTASDSTLRNSTGVRSAAPKSGSTKSTAKSSAAKPAASGASKSVASPTRKIWAGGRNGFIVDSAEAASLWPVKGPAPLPGALLPAKRIVAYYGNPLSKRMGILGELPPDQMLARLDREVERWRKADPATPVQPALHLIAVVAQADPGREGKYRLRMTDSLIERVYGWAQKRNAILFLDVQVGKSTLQAELPRLAEFLKRPNVHLGIDPEFSMKGGHKPGTRIGSFDAADVNFASRFLADLVEKENIPPKVLVIHRFTRTMLTNTTNIRLDPRVQVVIHMDGWGPPWLKLDSYHDYVYLHPVQYTGFKLFYHNDTKKGHPLMTPEQVLKLFPKPLYIQYQ